MSKSSRTSPKLWEINKSNPPTFQAIDANKGIVSNTHKEYTELTDRMTEINKNSYLLIDYFDTK